MAKLTEKTAIVESLKMWIWLYQNPGKGKEDSPYWDQIKAYVAKCPLCEIFFCKDCYGCPLKPGKYNGAWYCADMAFQYWKKTQSFRYAAYIASKLRRYARKKGWSE